VGVWECEKREDEGEEEVTVCVITSFLAFNPLPSLSPHSVSLPSPPPVSRLPPSPYPHPCVSGCECRCEFRFGSEWDVGVSRCEFWFGCEVCVHVGSCVCVAGWRVGVSEWVGGLLIE